MDNVVVAAEGNSVDLAPVPVQEAAPTPPDDLGGIDALFSVDEVKQEQVVEAVEVAPVDPTTYELPWEAGSSPLADDFRNFASENRISPEAVKAVATWYKQAEEKAAVAEQEAKVQRERDAIVELKNTYPDFQAKSKEVAAAAVRLGGKEFLEALKEGGLIADKRVFNALLNARKVSSDFNADVVGVSVQQAPSSMSVADIDAKVLELIKNPEYKNPYSKEGSALHAEAVRLSEVKMKLLGK
jgi:hypothetical protein